MLAYIELRPTSDIKQCEIFGRVPAKVVCPLAKEVAPTPEIVLGNLKAPSREVFSNFPQNSLTHTVYIVYISISAFVTKDSGQPRMTFRSQQRM